MKTRYDDSAAYVTRDGSQIRELMHPAVHGNHRQSLAEAVVLPGQATRLHRHRLSEELYHVTRGTGVMTLGAETLELAVGDTVLIPPGTAHSVTATGSEPLHLLCCCSPAYDHHDTELL
ncbi:MAG: cupin domain-containing protein [Candidatus Accumulibacter sp.]|uniref:cupin domain-containing protein n=1 Tax=Accumulibacter sp. TaxID=2053492 RepID=UPI0025E19E66|nr:cupin domain-containing protein [Accumulibacter sp.]MCP5247989.1 cupin domain-containing protein [Accumulibacter sp.]